MSRILRVLPLVLFASTSLLAAAEIQWGGQVGAHRFHPESEILILDGIPRNAHQAQILETNIKVINLIYLEAMDEEQVIERLHRRALHENRLDDAKETVIRKRFEEYDRESRPVLDFYAPELNPQN